MNAIRLARVPTMGGFGLEPFGGLGQAAEVQITPQPSPTPAPAQMTTRETVFIQPTSFIPPPAYVYPVTTPAPTPPVVGPDTTTLAVLGLLALGIGVAVVASS